MFPKTPHLPIPPETEIRTPALDLNLAHQHAASIPHVDAVSAPAVHVAKHIALDPVRRARVRVREYSSVGQERGTVFPEDAVGVDGRSAAGIDIAVAVDEIRVGHV